MKYLGLLLCFSLILSTTGCNKKLNSKDKGNVMEVNDDFLFDQTKEPYIVVFIKRTTCFGECPAYEAKIYSDGKVSYAGKAYVEKRGNYEAKIPLTKLNSIIQKAFQNKYFLLEDRYPDPSVQIADAPTTITSIVCKGQNKTISNKFNGPPELKEIENYIDEVLNSLQFTSIDPVK